MDRLIALATSALVLAALAFAAWPPARAPSHPPPIPTTAGPPAAPSMAVRLRTTHYTIASNATPEQTARVAEAVEQLHAAYSGFLADHLATQQPAGPLSLVLYRDQSEFKRYNRSRPWAEAYYLRPHCHAYFDTQTPNPYHWMLHEATHQLGREVARLPRVKWMDEGLASYFGASRVEHGRLQPGRIDRDTYPIWWLHRLGLSGDLHKDLRRGRIIPLRELVTDTGPGIDTSVNLYYIQYWSLTHYLLHAEGGRHANAYRALLARGGSLEQFEAAFGPIERIEREWYAYLRERIAEVASAAPEP